MSGDDWSWAWVMYNGVLAARQQGREKSLTPHVKKSTG